MSLTILTVALRSEHDVVATRQRARQIAALVGFETLDQTRIATAVSEIARNAVDYGGGGQIEFSVEGHTPPQLLRIRVTDRGPGIAELAGILDGQYRSVQGLGLGIVGARRLVDRFEIDSGVGRGTTVVLKQVLPPHSPLLTPGTVGPLVDALGRQGPRDPLQELQQQNRELLATLDALWRRQDELTRLNRELEDTNRGVIALYAELDEKADHLRRADALKTRFLSNMSHEFRTPVNSISALARLLLDHADGPLTVEQTRQVEFIQSAARDLGELVDDLLDLAKVEAGKTVVRPIQFEVGRLFGALRGMLRPLLVGEAVSLVFEDPPDLPPLLTDEGKVSQILRNFLSNALKFTERGEIRVTAALTPDGEQVALSVADTGIGIAPEDQERIFEQFGQVDHPVQRRVRGTGLGLPLSRRLAELLGGCISLTSAVGVGSTFSLIVPLMYTPSLATLGAVEVDWAPDPNRAPVLVVEDSPATLLLYEKYLRGTRFQVLPARSLRQAEQALTRVRPAAIVLDILLPGEDAWRFLTRLKTGEATRDVPVLVVTAVDDEGKARALGADAYAAKPFERQWLVDQLARLTEAAAARRILLIDDEEISRYLLRQTLRDPHHVLLEATSGPEGLRRARAEQPHVIVLDLVMPDVSGLEVLERLQADPATRHIPVVIVTSKVLTAGERAPLAERAVAILSKATLLRDDAMAAVRDAFLRVGHA